jgi:hypothetical protein
MKAGRQRRAIHIYASIFVLTICIIAAIFVISNVYPADTARYPANAAIAQSVPSATTIQEAASDTDAPTNNIPDAEAAWTFMVYINADDTALEGPSINDFLEMASVGSNENVNIVVQFDRAPGYDASYDDWTDCRRFLITEGLTPADGNELMNIGEVNMGDPATLVDFVKWSVLSYPADKYALIISSHGKGWEGCCWDETSSNDNMTLFEIGAGLGDISSFIGRPLDVVGFDACLMGMTEVAYEIRDYASVMIASEHAEPSSGWPYDAILAQLVETPEMDAAQLATNIVDIYHTSHAPTSYTMAAVDLTRIESVIDSLGNLAQSLVVYAGTDSDPIKEYAGALMTAINDAVISEKHGIRWPGSYGLAIYFPKTRSEFNQAYSAAEVTLANVTAWDEFLHGYFTYSGDDWITAAREGTQQYYVKEHVDLYDFCQKLIGE